MSDKCIQWKVSLLDTHKKFSKQHNHVNLWLQVSIFSIILVTNTDFINYIKASLVKCLKSKLPKPNTNCRKIFSQYPLKQPNIYTIISSSSQSHDRKRGRPIKNQQFQQQLALWLKNQNRTIFSKKQIDIKYRELFGCSRKNISIQTLQRILKMYNLQGISIIKSHENGHQDINVENSHCRKRNRNRNRSRKNQKKQYYGINDLYEIDEYSEKQLIENGQNQLRKYQQIPKMQDSFNSAAIYDIDIGIFLNLDSSHNNYQDQDMVSGFLNKDNYEENFANGDQYVGNAGQYDQNMRNMRNNDQIFYSSDIYMSD